MFSKREVCINTHANEGDVVSGDGLVAIQNVVLVLAEEARVLGTVLQIEVCLDRVEEHDGVARRHLYNMLDNILALQVVDFMA